MLDYYRDLATDYHWIFPDEIVTFPGVIGGTSVENVELIQEAVRALPPGAAVLDCACGIGTDAMALAHAGFQVTATDGSPSMAAEARRRLPADVQVLVARWEELPVAGPYELVLCLGNSLVHAGSHEAMVAALSGMRRVLSPTGTLIVDSRNWELLYRERHRIVTSERLRERDGMRSCWVYVWSIPERFGEPCLAEIVLLLVRPDGGFTHRRYPIEFQPFTPAQLKDRLTEAGFEITGSSYHADRQRYAFTCRPTGPG
ncbi:Methyltransferase domain-containing protein [Nonomuraea solani]|uniref:Methyltransferase domain-containing protein n=1 Tax=Nonomuraea solani TaxID=1144553 RepID=A0A1H6E9D3_9ACTN|nr:class I SAM-dependent methyltransferase [Nonomuraea solani]SEG94302.1 Methyltransferase domain-containing protein [Nonomuraea solani]